MKGDFTRFTFEPKKHYTSVRMQQGRVQLDSDWNEQADIQTHLTQSVAKHMIGVCGTHKHDGGFRIEPTTDNKDLWITPGNIYVDGILCELESTPFVATYKGRNLLLEVESLDGDSSSLESLEQGQLINFLDENDQQIGEKNLKIQEIKQEEEKTIIIFDISKFDLDIDVSKITKLRLEEENQNNIFKITSKTQSLLFKVDILNVDGSLLAKEQWVEVFEINGKQTEPQLLEIQNINQQENTLTFTENLNIDIPPDELTKIKLRRVNITYTTQPDYPNPEFPEQSDDSEQEDNSEQKKYYLAYLDVWQRHITAIEAPNIREVGLNGPDTTTRTKTIWQVKIQEFTPTNPKISCSNLQELSQAERNELRQSWKEEKANTNRGSLTVTVENDSRQQWENQLYRVEIHDSGEKGKATFKWSRDNGSTVFAIDSIQGNKITLKNFGIDLSSLLSSGGLIEVTDEVKELQGKPGTLVDFKDQPSGNEIFFDSNNQNKINNAVLLDRKPKAIIWNKSETISTEKISLEKGITLNFDSEAHYQTGDYWLIPTRKVKVNNTHVDLPLVQDKKDQKVYFSSPQPPDGIEHHYCPLALLCYDGAQFNVLDLRETFPSLSNCLDKTGDVMTGGLVIDNGSLSREDLEPIVPGELKVAKSAFLAIADGNVKIGNSLDSTAKLAVKGNTDIIDGKLTVTNNNNVVLATTDDNKVGIGKNNPQAKLEVVGNAKITDSLGIATDIEEHSTDKLAVKGNTKISDGKLTVNNNNNVVLATTDDYKVGIGTEEPKSKLEVVGDVKISGSQSKLLVDGNVNIGSDPFNSTAKLAVKGNTDIIDGELTVTNDADVVLATTDDNKVGIGTDDPQAKLEVIGNTKISDGELTVTNGDDVVLATTDDNKVGIGKNDPQAKLEVVGNTKISDGELIVTNGADVVLATTDDNKVGIGKNDPQAKLEVVGDTKISGSQYKLLVDGNVNIGDPLDSTAKLAVKGNTDIIDGELTVTNGDDVVLATTDNKVGIGKNDPQAKLEVVGNAKITDSLGIGTDSPDSATKLDVAGKVKIKDGVGIGTEAPTSGLTVKGKVDIVSDSTQNTRNPEADEAHLYVRGDVYIDGEVYANTIRSEDSRLSNSSGLGIIDAQFINSLIINPDSAYEAIALYNSVGISGGLAVGELSPLPEGELKVINSVFLATAENTQVSIGTSQKPQENNLLGVAGNTTIGSSYANTKPAPPNGLLVEGKTHIGDNPPIENLEANEAQLYVKGNAYIDGEIYAENIRTTGFRLNNSSGLSIIDTQFTDSLILNPDSHYQAIALYKSVGINNGGLAVGELSSLPDGELKVTNSVYLATNGGSVRIGKDSPDSDTKLDVVGNVRIAGGMGIGKEAPESGVRVNGIIEADNVQTQTIIARDFMQESSQEYKDNITNLSIQESKQILNNLKPVKYSYRKDPSQKLHAGFIAEESHDLFTSADKTMLNSTGIIAILTSVLKEQMYENSDLNRLILQQQQEIDQLSIRLRKIEKSQRKRPLGFGFMNIIRNMFT